VAGVTLAYFAAARLGLLLQLPETNVSPVWPPSGIGLAALLALGLRVWPGILAGAVLSNLLTLPRTPAGLLASGAIGVGNTLEQVLALLLLRRLLGPQSPFDRPGGVFRFVATAGLACAVAGTNGAAVLWLTGLIPGDLVRPAWLTWWLGDLAGMLVFTPAVYCWWRAPRPALSAARAAELAALVALTALTAEVLFGGWIESELVGSLPYLVVPWLLWAAFRFGPRETASLAVVVLAIAVGHTWWFMGHPAGRAAFAPFLGPAAGANDSLLMLQIFACAVAVTGVALAAALSERGAVLRALAESERRFRTVFEQSAVGAALVETPTGRFVRVNRCYCDLVGYSADEMARTTSEAITHPDDVRADRENVRRLAADEVREFRTEKRHVRKDGSVVWVNFTVSPTWRPGERPEHHVAIVEDITERRRAQEALRQREEQLRLVTDHAPVLIAHIDRDGRYRFVNRAYAERLGLSAAEVVGKRIPEVVGRAAYESFRPHVEAALSGRRVDFEAEVPYGGLGRRWMRCAYVPEVDAAGAVRGLIAVLHDITARKRGEERLRLVVEAAPCGMVMVGPDGTIVVANAQVEPLFGYSPEELLGQSVEMLVPERFRGEHPASRAGFFAAPQPRVMGAGRDLYGRRKDGSEVPVEIGLNPIQTEGGPFVIAALIDITARKRAEEEIRRLNAELEGRVRQRTAELEAANQELEAFSYSVSHDLRAPLRAIDGFSRILLKDHAGELPPEGREFLQLVRDNARQMGQLVDDLLTFSRLGRQPVRKQPVDPGKLVRQCLEELPPEHEGRRVEVTVADLPACRAEPTLLKQVWVNLLSNALKYTRKCEHTRVEVGCLARDSGGPAYYVRDNGVGFDMRYADKLFGVFQRLHRAEDYEGTGVGLAIVRRVVQRHGGRVWAEAQPGRGATFYFTLGDGGSS
jgi:PAS domain S-box-containing protein